MLPNNTISHETNSHAPWSFNFLVWQWKKNKLRCCLIIQLSHVTNSFVAWSFSFLIWHSYATWSIPILTWQTHMLPDHSAFSCDKLICCLIKSHSHETNSYVAWSFSFLIWQTHMLHDQFPFSHDKLICCLIIQLSHMTNSYAAWSIPILTWQTHMLPDHSAFSRDKLICCLIIQHSHVTKTIEFLFFENPHITHKSICLLTLHWVENICHWMVRWKYDHWHDLIQDVVKWYKYFTKTKKSPQISK
jgi:hypothetical protein